MNKLKISSLVAKELGIKNHVKNVLPIIDSAFTQMFTAVANGETVTLAQIGTFERKTVAARTARKPPPKGDKTGKGEPLTIPARERVVFHASPVLQDFANMVKGATDVIPYK